MCNKRKIIQLFLYMQIKIFKCLHGLYDHFLLCKAVDFEVVKKSLDEETWWELLA